MENVTSIVLVEFRPGLLEARQERLESLGHPVISVQGLPAAKRIDLSRALPGIIIIGHRGLRNERRSLITYLRQMANNVPILILLCRDEDAFGEADYNCPFALRLLRDLFAAALILAYFFYGFASFPATEVFTNGLRKILEPALRDTARRWRITSPDSVTCSRYPCSAGFC